MKRTLRITRQQLRKLVAESIHLRENRGRTFTHSDPEVEDAVDSILGPGPHSSLSNGYNAGPEEGEAYNEFMQSNLGYTEMFRNPNFGPKIDMSDWELIAQGGERFAKTRVYAHRDEEYVLLQSGPLSGDRGTAYEIVF